MKKMSKIQHFLLLSLLFYSLLITAQTPFCTVIDDNNASSSITFDNCISSCADGTDNEFFVEQSPIIIQVNFHYFLDANGSGNFPRPEDALSGETDGVEASDEIINLMNNSLQMLTQNALSNANIIPFSQIRFERFSDNQNANDIYGGVWFYDNVLCGTANPFNNFNIFGGGTYKNCFSEYNDQVIDIFLGDNPNCNGTGAANINGNRLAVCGLYDEHINGNGIGSTRGLLLHELLHNLGLHHTFHCSSTVIQDLDVAAECNNPNGCTNSNGGNGCNPFSSGGNNIMGYNIPLNSLTPCQVDFLHRRFLESRPDYVKVDFCTISEPDIVISNGEDITWNLSRHLNRNIVIKSGGKLTIKAIIAMPEDSRITVEPNGKLILDCAKITSRCDNKWDGIVVKGNTSAHQFELNSVRQQGFLRIKNSTIENATFAVRTYNPDQSDPNFLNERGGIVIASDSDFKNNQQSVSIVDYQGYNPFTNQPYRNLSSFSNCTFTIDNDYIGNYLTDFRQHIYLRQITGIPFNGCDFVNEFAGLDYAHQRQIGIESRDADFMVSAFCLDSGVTTYPCNNLKFSNFRGMGYGINAFNSASANTFRVSRTNFSANFVGISANSVNNIYAVRNNFYVGMTLPPQYADTYYTGMQLFRTTGYQVEDNDFFASTEVAPNDVTIGSAVSGSWREANEIYRNEYDGLMYGNLSNGDNRNGVDAKIGLQYQCNDNISNDYDFGVDEFSDIAEDQGSANLSAGNCFSNNINVPESDFRNEAASINYFYDNNCFPTDVSNSVILPQQDSPINTCPSGIPDDERGKLSAFEKQSLQQDFSQSSDETIQTHSANKLIRDYLIDEENYNWTTARTWLDNKGSLESHFMIVDSWLYEGNTNQATQALNNIQSQFTLSGEEKEEHKQFSKLKDIQIQAINNGISVEKMVTDNMTQISGIANTGDLYAAKQAQGLVNSVQENTYIPTLLLPGGSSQQSIAPNTGGINNAVSGMLPMLQAAPNPTKDATIFTYQLPNNLEIGKIEIRNIQGQLLDIIQLSENNGSINWNAGKLNNGVYLYSLIAKNKIIANQRLVVTK